MATVPYTIENQTGSDIVLRDNTILDGDTYEIPIKESFYNAFNAGVFNRDFTGITITCTDNSIITRVEFWDIFNELQNSNLININTQGIESVKDGIPTSVIDEDDRDSLYPYPADGLFVYNERINLIEKYYSEFGLWLNANVVVVQNTSDLDINRAVIFDGENIINSFAYPDIKYPTTNGQKKYVEGIIIQKGKNDFASLAIRGMYYIEHGETILVGEFIKAKTGGTNSDIGKIEGTSNGGNGIIGTAYQNSGSTTGKSNLTLVIINPTERK